MRFESSTILLLDVEVRRSVEAVMIFVPVCIALIVLQLVILCSELLLLAFELGPLIALNLLLCAILAQFKL